MTTPTSRNAYRPYYEILDRALASEAGLRIRVSDRGAANQLRVRLHTARSLDRDLARSAYELEDPKHGISVYDELTVRVVEEEGGTSVIIEPNRVIGEIEEIEA